MEGVFAEPETRVAKPDASWHSGRMSTKMMEQKLAELQQRVERLEGKVMPAKKGTWRDAIGFAKDDDLFIKAMRLGAEGREKANRAGR